jgi:hypothetical protein
MLQIEELECRKLPPPPEWASSPPALPGPPPTISGGYGGPVLPSFLTLPRGGRLCRDAAASTVTVPNSGGAVPNCSGEVPNCSDEVPNCSGEGPNGSGGLAVLRTVRFEPACGGSGPVCGLNRAASLDRKRTKSNSHIESIV